MLFKVLIEAKILPHCYALHYCHPRSVVISSLWSRFSCFEYEKHCLKGAESGNVHEGIRMFYGHQSIRISKLATHNSLEANANHC